jgi:tRNA A-37 threonylcarbamoyl transferase component Bud32
MQELSLSEYRRLTHQAEPLTSELVDGHVSHKVLQLPDQSILKLFRLKRLLTSARLFPYTKRFQRNVSRLESLGIPTVAITAVYRIPVIKRTAVHYRFLPGMTLRDHCEKNGMNSHIAEKFGNFFSFLHQNGVYFRSIHFGNMVLTVDHRIGLIDVVDMRFRRMPLNMRMRIRNLRHLFRYGTDIDCLAPLRHIFIDAYCKSTRFRRNQERHFRRHFEDYFRRASVNDGIV